MGLRCLLGHDFTEPTTERERDERGDEVITTIREVKECRRCGETQVVTENTEVTSLDVAFDDGPEPTSSGLGGVADRAAASGADGDTSVAPGEGPASGVTADSTAAVDDAEPADDGFDHPRGDPADADPTVDDDAEIIRDGPVRSDATAGGEPGEPGEADGSTERSTAGSADASSDGVSTGERAHGEWPDADRTHPTDADGENMGGTPREWPDPDARTDDAASHWDSEGEAATEARSGVATDADRTGADGHAAAPDDEDVEFIDAEEHDDAGPSSWPEQEGDDEGFDAEIGDGRADEDVSVDGNLTPRVNPNAEVDEDAEFIEASSSSPSTPDRAASNGHGTGGSFGGSSDSSTAAPSRSGAARNGAGSTNRTGPSAGAHEVELTTTVDDRSFEYVCPDCGKRERVGASSMRAGDICPECKRGYIEERELE